MFYGQCWKCGERWEIGTAPTCKCQEESEPYKFTDNHIEVLRLSKDGIWANPDISVDEAAKLVLAAMEWNIKVLVDKAVADERERIFQELLRMHENTKGAHNYFLHAVGTIRARSKDEK